MVAKMLFALALLIGSAVSTKADVYGPQNCWPYLDQFYQDYFTWVDFYVAGDLDTAYLYLEFMQQDDDNFTACLADNQAWAAQKSQ